MSASVSAASPSLPAPTDSRILCPRPGKSVAGGGVLSAAARGCCWPPPVSSDGGRQQTASLAAGSCEVKPPSAAPRTAPADRQRRGRASRPGAHASFSLPHAWWAKFGFEFFGTGRQLRARIKGFV